jgi:hypothetical protein
MKEHSIPLAYPGSGESREFLELYSWPLWRKRTLSSPLSLGVGSGRESKSDFTAER